MDHYTKSSSSATDVEPVDVNVKSGSKLKNVISQSFRLLQNKKQEKITIMGSGPTVTKAITCAEIIKRKTKGLHQMNKLFYTKIEDTWDPNESSLDKLQVTRKIPSIRITLSRVPLDSSQPGYQGPGNSRSPVQFRDEDWELAQEEPSTKTSEKPFSGQPQSKSEKKNKDNRERFYKQNHKGCSDTGTGRNKQISKKEAGEKAMELPGDHVRKGPDVYSAVGTEDNNVGHFENELKSDSNSRGEELQNFGSQNSDSSENKHHQYGSWKDSCEKGRNPGGNKSKQSPRKKKKAE